MESDIITEPSALLVAEPVAESVPAKPKAAAPPPDRFPISLAEYAITTHLDVLWARGLEVYTDGAARMKEEWDRVLEEFKRRPVTS